MAKVPTPLRKALYDYMEKSEEQKTDDLIKSAFAPKTKKSTEYNLKK